MNNMDNQPDLKKVANELRKFKQIKPKDFTEGDLDNLHKVKLILRTGLDGGTLGYSYIILLNYSKKQRMFETQTDVGYQLIHRAELVNCLYQYKEEK